MSQSRINVYELLYMYHFRDEYAERELIRKYGGYVAMIARNMLISYPDLMTYEEDFIQEGMISLVKAIDCYREDMNACFKTFATIVVRRRISNLITKYLRSADMLSQQTVSLDSENNFCVPENTRRLDEPEYRTRYHEAVENLNRSVSQLNVREERIFREIVSDTPYKTAADKLGYSLKSYTARVSQVRRKIISQVMKPD